MTIRPSTIWLPLLALSVVTILLSHDLVMAVGPHDLEGHASHDHQVRHDAPSSDTEPGDPVVACGTFQAVRATDRYDYFDSDPMLDGPPAPFQTVDVSEPVMTAPAEPGASPGQIRAMFQVYLI